MILSPTELAKIHAATHALMGIDGPCHCADCRFVTVWRELVAQEAESHE